MTRLDIAETMEDKYAQSYQCMGCRKTLTDETALFDVDNCDAVYCEACFYEFPFGPFFGEHDKDYEALHPSDKQQFCIDCQRCCKGCWYLAPHKGCTIYPYRPRYCRGYECDKLKAQFG